MGENFFDKHAEFYGNIEPLSYDHFFANFIKKKKKKSIVDLGGGSGVFVKIVKKICPEIDVTVIDQSKVLLNEIKDSSIKKIHGKLPFDISLDKRYDIIHIKEVLHHLVTPSINESKALLKKSLVIHDLLEDDGYLLIHELFYESFLIPTLSRTIIFYLLALQNNFRFNIPVKEFLSGLNVVFYSRQEFAAILKNCGYNILTMRIFDWNHSFKTRLLLLKNWGRMLFILEKKI